MVGDSQVDDRGDRRSQGLEELTVENHCAEGDWVLQDHGEVRQRG